MKAVFTIFYAWQSDHPSGQCRYLIAEALDTAAKELSDDPTVPYCVEIDQDSKGVPGLCDIPATILEKIENCDALVADLTFVANSTADPPRYCSNPNVLFELGFAFHAIKPERLILVMNEHHGPKTNQIFDLDHRRHPVAYSYPGNHSRGETISQLASELVRAFRPILALGRRADSSSDRVNARQSEVAQLRTELKLLGKEMNAPYSWDGAIFPASQREYWKTLVEVEQALREHQARGHDGHEYPPQTKGNERHSWGIANSLYGEPWLATKSGVFMCRQPMDFSQGPFPPNSRYDPTAEKSKQIEPGKWVDILTWREEVFTFFDFASRWSTTFKSHEDIAVELNARIEGLHLVAARTVLERFVEMVEPSVAKEYRFGRTITAEQLGTGWKEICADAIDAFVELFPPTMGQGFGSSRAWVVSERGR